MTFCPKCGNPVKKIVKFCPKCGVNIPIGILKRINKKLFYFIIPLIIIAFLAAFLLVPVKEWGSSSLSKENSLLNLFAKKSSVSDYCGDNVCSEKETCKDCIKDCGDCRIADYEKGEYCGDGKCKLGECSARCVADCSISDCVDGICDYGFGENCENSPDCVCGSGTRCESSQCVTYCGNGICEENEKNCDINHCEADCGACTCEYLKGNVCDKKEVCSLGYFDKKAKDTDMCCLGVCEDNPDYYPLILVHGHTPTSATGLCNFAGYTNCREGAIKSFDSFQNRMYNEGLYIDKGYILPGENINNVNEGEWGNYDLPISIIMTYYANTNVDDINEFNGDDYNQRIDEYSKRLERVVELVMHHTGSKKVKIVAHSMGGLVTRQYIKYHNGDKYVDRVIFIGTPNHGIKGGIGELCGDLDQSSRFECDDMKSGSSFLQSLNSNDETPGETNYLTIAGTVGQIQETTDPCGDGSGLHDETICADSVSLNGAQSLQVVGHFVPGLETFHGKLIDPDYTSQVYSYTKDFLRK